MVVDRGLASTMQTPLTEGQTWINDIETDGIKRGCFNHHQAGDAIRGASTGDDEWDGSNVHTYNVSTFSEYNAYGDDGGAGSGDTASDGDRWVVGHPSETTGLYTGPAAEVTFSPAFQVGIDNEPDATKNCGGVLLFADGEIITIDRNSDTDVHVMFCFQILISSSSTWFTIDKTEKFYSFAHNTIGTENVDLPFQLSTLVTPDTIDTFGTASTDDLEGARLMMSIKRTGANNPSVTLERFKFTWAPIFGRDPS
jgi:hypothetical protein